VGESGFVDDVKGRVKEALGSLLDDADMKRAGRADRAAAKAKDKTDEVIDKARDAVRGDDGSTSQ